MRIPASFCPPVAAAFLLVLVAMAAHGGDAVVPGDLVVEPSTHECLGFEWDVTGDDNRNATVAVAWRPARVWPGKWRQGHPLLRIQGERTGSDKPEEAYVCGNLFAGSIVDLAPGLEYEVRLSMTDPDGGGAERTVRIRTRPEPRAPKPTRTLHLYPSGFEGAKKEPFFTDFKEACAEVRPGECVLVHAGVHRAAAPHDKGKVDFLLEKAGTVEKPIVIRGAGDGEAILEGDGNQLLVLRGADHTWIQDLTLRDADNLVRVNEGDSCVGLVVQRCKLEQSQGPIWLMSGKCREASILDNVFVGPAREWTPRNESGEKFGQSHAVWIAGQGHAVSWNRVSGYWDGIDVFRTNPNGPRTERNCAIDFSHNEVSECIDDAFEMDYGVHNLRVSRNFVWNCFMGISAQPVYAGPGYIFRNVAFNILRAGLKLNVYPAGLVIYHNTFLVVDGFRNGPLWQNTTLRNNLFLGMDGREDGFIWTGTPTPATSSMDYNGYRVLGCPPGRAIFWRFAEPTRVASSGTPQLEATFANLAEFHRATGYEKHAVEVDYDFFVTAQAMSGRPEPLPQLDLRLRDKTAAVDAGQVLPNFNDGYQGGAPDLGAIELGQPVPHYGPRPAMGR